MKKLIFPLSIWSMSIISIGATGQTSQIDFIAHTTSPTEIMVVQNGIEVSYQPGTIGKSQAFCLAFKNKNDAAIAFTYTLQNKNGDTVYCSPQAYLDGDAGMGFAIAETEGFKFAFPVTDGTTPGDYKININLKK